ncbi:MAG: aminotransferase class V-fold PLP-dependent enzyme [Pseudomonadaceae bacterium]|nr:aminotransferase class V-fold PLP-dependent enzyme [Pseudomonadaceae bacterium]
MSQPIYLDYAATTPVDPEVARQMADCLTLTGTFGNPASTSHGFGWDAQEKVEIARAQVAALLNVDVREIIWTSGATESDNLAIKGVMAGSSRRHIVTSAIEHKAVLDTCAFLESSGVEVTYLTPDSSGIITAQQLSAALRPDTALVSLMHANNEIGVLNDIDALGTICRDAGVLFHVDAAQSVGKLPLDLASLPVDLLSLSAHKFYGPKGIGALYIRRNPGFALEPQIHGGGHEFGFRSGTLATHQIVGLGAAAKLAQEHLANEVPRLTALRQRLLSHLSQIPGSHLNGDPQRRLPGIVNVSFEAVDGETLMNALAGIAVSNGSACTSATVEPSFVLTAIGVPRELALGALRISVGRFTSEADIDAAGQEIADVVGRLRS